MSKKIEADLPPPTFETSLAELEEAVGQLEAGELPLEESLRLFERGVASLKQCHEILDRAEKRIRILVKGARGEAVLEDVGVIEPLEAANLSGEASDNPPGAKKLAKLSLDSGSKKGQNTPPSSSPPDDQSGLW